MGAQQISCYFSHYQIAACRNKDLKLFIPDPDPADNFGSDRIHNTGWITFGLTRTTQAREADREDERGEDEGGGEGVAVPPGHRVRVPIVQVQHTHRLLLLNSIVCQT